MARGRFPQGPTASRPVGKLHTFGRVCLQGGQKYFSLPSLAAQLQACVYPFTLQPQVSAKKKCTSGLVLATPVVFTWGFFPFCQQLLFAAAHKPAPQERGDCSFQSQTPLAAAPLRGLPARYLCGCRHRSAVPTSSFKYPSGEKQSRLGCSAWICFVPRTDAVPIKKQQPKAVGG